ncbi:MAG: PASTA domain-containing protein [Bacteroidales bacterium]
MLKTVFKGVAALFLLLVLIYFSLNLITRHNREFSVPNFSGLTFEEAIEKGGRGKLKLEIKDSLFVSNMKRGVIFKQNPPPHSKVKKGRRVLLTINSHLPKKVIMPSLVGLSLRQAKAELNSKELQLGTLHYQPDIATNNTLAQLYKGREISPGTLIEAGSSIDLKVGTAPGEGYTSIPSLIGFSLETAKDILVESSLNLGRVKYHSSITSRADSLSAFIVEQSPSAGKEAIYPLGTRVTLSLSTDKELLKSIQK